MQKRVCDLCNLSKWHHWTRLLQVPQTTFCKSQLVKSIVHRSRHSRSCHHRESGKKKVFFLSDVYVIHVLVNKRHKGTHVKYWLYFTVENISADFCVCEYFIGVLATNMDCILTHFQSLRSFVWNNNSNCGHMSPMFIVYAQGCKAMGCKSFVEHYTFL